MAHGVVAITGAAGALGAAVARRCARDGMRVLLLDSERAKDRLAKLEAELGGAGEAVSAALDVSDAKGWGAALERAKSAFGAAPTAAALIAGGWAGGAPLYEAKDDEAWRAMIASNASTVYASLRALLPGMVAAKSGSVVVVGSRAVERPWTSANAASYAASKAAVVALAQTVAEEVLPHGVRVNAILPSTMDTPANRAAMPKADFSKWVSTDSAASVVAFLLSDEARDVSGAAIPVYGRA